MTFFLRTGLDNDPWADVRLLLETKPKMVIHWSRADCVYSWIGRLVRRKKRHIAQGYSSCLAIVTEVGPAGWLGVVSNNPEQDGKAMNTMDVDSWSPPDAWSFKGRLLRMEVPEAELRSLLSNVDVKNLPKCPPY